LFRAYLKQMLVDGFFHADPHPGNVFLTDDDRIALLDLGMVANITPKFQDELLRLLLAISEGRGDEAAEISIRMGEPKPDFGKSDFTHRVGNLVARHANATLKRIDAGHVVLEIERISADCWFRLPPEFTMIAKTLLNLDRVVYTLAPDFDPNAIIREEASHILTQRMMKSIQPGRILSGVVEVKEFVEKFPTRVNKILDVVGNNELKIGVDAIDEKVVLDQPHHARSDSGGANRGRGADDARRNFVQDPRLPRTADNFLPAGGDCRHHSDRQHRLLRREAEEEKRRGLSPKPRPVGSGITTQVALLSRLLLLAVLKATD